MAADDVFDSRALSAPDIDAVVIDTGAIFQDSPNFLLLVLSLPLINKLAKRTP